MVFDDQPPTMPQWHGLCVSHVWLTCVGWCLGCAQDHRAGKHTCQAGIPIRKQTAREHPHTCAWCYPLPAHDRPPVNQL
ncbi:hypothetical protein GCM10023198_31470 [Promicromonospora umidemergens]|uniref:Secreted protein n=1 Tax=Promicromonospora umidemergens TaxID=629679 RepID=A0ABP8XF34_9MICO